MSSKNELFVLSMGLFEQNRSDNSCELIAHKPAGPDGIHLGSVELADEHPGKEKLPSEVH